MDATDLMWEWVRTLADDAPDPALVAALEAAAVADGWHPIHAFVALTAAQWSPDLHPRGRDGKFIEKLGVVQLFGKIRNPGNRTGNSVDLTGRRGKVVDIIPDPKRPGSPDVIVELQPSKFDNGGIKQRVRVKPDMVQQAPEKARLDIPLEKPTSVNPDARRQGNQPAPPTISDDDRRAAIGRLSDDAVDALAREDSPDGDLARAEVQRRTDEIDQRKADLRRRAKGLPDEQLQSERARSGIGDDIMQRDAAETELANRAERRAKDAEARAALIADVNADAANLSTTDPEARARGLDDILAKLRFSIIDTDKVHDNIYPPGESGRWTKERAAQHEDMWNEVLAQVQASSIPQDRDALVLGGLPGAGKSFTLRPGQAADSFGVVAWEPGQPMPEGATHVSLNPDIVKEMLIARGMLPEGISSDLKPMEQVTFLHEESSYIAKLMSKRLGDLGYNVVLDNTMDSEGGMLKRMTPLAREGYKFRGIFVDIPIDESKASAKKRYIDAALTDVGGRFVPSSVQGNRTSSRGNMSKNRDAMDSLVEQDWFTEYMILDNTGITNRTPKGEIVAQGTGGGTAADRYLPGADAARPKAGPQVPTPPEAPPTIDVNAPLPPGV